MQQALQVEQTQVSRIPVLHVERDVQGLQLAFRELFEESFAETSMRSLLEKIGDDPDDPDTRAMRESILADAPQRTLSPGYYDRCHYLLSLGAAIEAGAQYSAAMLAREDVQGLRAIKLAKSEFERDHPGCPRCGTRQESRFAASCGSCQYKLAGGRN